MAEAKKKVIGFNTCTPPLTQIRAHPCCVHVYLIRDNKSLGEQPNMICYSSRFSAFNLQIENGKKCLSSGRCGNKHPTNQPTNVRV